MKNIYLDHAAATPLCDEAWNAMRTVYTSIHGNPSSIHRTGREARALVEYARGKVAGSLGATSEEITFTGSGTEANNLALFGTVLNRNGNNKGHILVSPIEHHSVLAAAHRLSGEGFDVEYLEVDATGRVSREGLYERLRDDTRLISIMYANNEIGTIEPIREIANMLERRFPAGKKPLFHTDACQAAGQLPLSPRELGVDLMTLNGSKLYGPKGVGMLYVRDGITLTPQLVGGFQEFGRRAGTENVALIVGFAEALAYAVNEQGIESKRLLALRDEFIEDVLMRLPSATLTGHKTERLPNNAHFLIPHIEGEALLLMLDSYGIAAATGSACSSESLSPSHVLRALHINTTRIHGSIRFSLGRGTTRRDLKETVRTLKECVHYLTSFSPLTSYEYR